MKVTGESLWPEYCEGDFVIVSKIPFFFNRVKRGDIIVFKLPDLGAIIKYIDRIDQNSEKYFVIGIHPDSLDSRVLGGIFEKDIIGKVLFHIKRSSLTNDE